MLIQEQTIAAMNGALQKKYDDVVFEQAHLLQRLNATIQVEWDFELLCSYIPL